MLISHPKSGRTWIRRVLEDLGYFISYSHRLETGVIFEDDSNLRKEVDPALYDKLIFLHRNPIDTAVSYFYFKKYRYQAFLGDIDEFVTSELLGVPKIAKYNLYWMSRLLDHENYLILSYEELKNREISLFTKLVRFITLSPVEENRIKDIVDQNSFDNMKKREQTGELASVYGDRYGTGPSGSDLAVKVRRGKVGGYRDELSENAAKQCEDMLQSLGYWDKISSLTPKIN